jgi:tyrosinase
MTRMHRRRFLTLAQLLGLSPWFADIADAQSTTPRIRRSVDSPLAVKDIDTLRRGVSLLKSATTDTDYSSWMYWANSHGMPSAVPAEMARVWARCPHRSRHFLSWHRAYLFFFEALVRELTKEDGFALPYWDWYASPAVPDAYLASAKPASENPLFHEKRQYRALTLVREALTRSDFFDFQRDLEGNPHGTVHVMVGGEMGSVETSARDALFWAHHANIDRMWQVWLAADRNRKNPSQTAWLGEEFVFDLAGKKSMVARQLLTPEEMGYRYESTAAAGTDVLPARPAKVVSSPSMMGVDLSASGEKVLSRGANLRLTAESVTYKLAVPPNARDKLNKIAAPGGSAAGSLKVRFTGVRPTEAGVTRGFEYRVYANLPSGDQKDGRHESHYLGVINSFQLGHHGSHGVTLDFALNAVALRLGAASKWTPGMVEVSLVNDDTAVGATLVAIDRIDLVLDEGSDI